MQPLYQHDSFEVVWPHLLRALFAISSIRIGSNSFQHDALFDFSREALSLAARQTYSSASKIDLNNRMKIEFIAMCESYGAAIFNKCR